MELTRSAQQITAWIAALVATTVAACPAPVVPCSESTDCPAGTTCLARTCTATGGGEGEGEGEGDAGEGEGEGEAGEGEGEGDADGEGEGEGDPRCGNGVIDLGEACDSNAIGCDPTTCRPSAGFDCAGLDPLGCWRIMPPGLATHASTSAEGVLRPPDVTCTAAVSTVDATNAGVVDVCGTPVVASVELDSGEPGLFILSIRSLTIAQNAELRFTGTHAVVLFVFGDARIAGTLNVSASGAVPGPGGGRTGLPFTACIQGTGGDGGGSNNPTGAGGGSSDGDGGDGGTVGPTVNNNGGFDLQRAVTDVPFFGGCPGGSGQPASDVPGGGGGGAVQVTVAGTLTLAGRVEAAGGAGAGGTFGGAGGGGGGAVLLQADNTRRTISGSIIVTGGGGGGGGDASTAGLDGQDGRLGGRGGEAADDSGGDGGDGASSGPNGGPGAGSAGLGFGAGGGGGGRGLSAITPP